MMLNLSHWESRLRALTRAEPRELTTWLEPNAGSLVPILGFILVGGALYGFTLGIWRAPLQGIFVAIKFPLLLMLTALGSALINGMLAQILGAPLTWRQSYFAVLMSFALLATILAAFSPLVLWLLMHLPAAGSADQRFAHGLYLLVNTGLIAFAGIMANLQLYRLLRHLCGEARQAQRIVWTWLAMNLFLGAQLSWNLRPFFGSPSLPVRFLREDPFAGNFYEAVFRLFFVHILGGNP